MLLFDPCFVNLLPCSAGKWEEAFELLDVMPSEGVKPDLTTCNIALDACVKVVQKYNYVFLLCFPAKFNLCSLLLWKRKK